MIVPVEFNYKGDKIISRLVYNFQVITDVIMAIPVILIPGYGDFVLFFKKNNSKIWEEVTQLSIRFPGTFKGLAERLADYFKFEGYLFQGNKEARKPNLSI